VQSFLIAKNKGEGKSMLKEGKKIALLKKRIDKCLNMCYD